MKSLALFLGATLALLCLYSVAVEARTQWFELEHYTFAHYIHEYNRQYANPAEFEMRKNLFNQRLHSILAHNKDSSKTWKRGINHLSDRTESELKQLLGYRKDLGYYRREVVNKDLIQSHPFYQQSAEILSHKLAALPEIVDWRDKGVVSAVKDQGHCGSCWSFASAETIESMWALKNKGALPVLSEQHILSCTANPNHCGGSGGCAGGTAELAFQSIIDQGGIASEWTYPYLSYQGNDSSCQFSPTKTPPAAKLQSFVALPTNEEQPLIEAVATHGPIAISVDASTWHDYETGIFNGCNQTNPDINHAVQLVGYGPGYWLVRNSWAPTWGENGYIRLLRSASSNKSCGTDLSPQDGTACDGSPATVTVCGTCGILYDNAYPIV